MSEVLVDARAAPGWYGKLPGLGDFASRRLPDPFVRCWDGWLQRGMQAAGAQLGEARWGDAYLVAPVLRFWLAPGLIDAQGWAGLMMPSIDRIGRRFPLTVARPLASLAIALAAHDWYRALDEAMRQVLDVRRTVDDFEDTLAAVAVAPPAAADGAAEALAAAVGGDGGPAPGAPASLWWCGDAGPGTAFRRFAQLPPEPAFAALMGATP